MPAPRLFALGQKDELSEDELSETELAFVEMIANYCHHYPDSRNFTGTTGENNFRGMVDALVTNELHRYESVALRILDCTEVKDPDNSKHLRRQVVKSDYTTEAVMLQALKDPSYEVRVAAASSKNATEDVLLEALNSDYADVRMVAVKSPLATEAVIRAVLDDHQEKQHVFDAARETKIGQKIMAERYNRTDVTLDALDI